MKVLLTHEKAATVKAGAEIFSGHLKKAFPGMKIIDYRSIKSQFTEPNSLFRVPVCARRLDNWFMKSGIRPDAILTNGMFGWSLKTSIPVINIQHGTLAAFAGSAMKKTTLNYWRTRFIYSRYERLSAQRADKVVSNSRFTSRMVKKYYGRNSSTINNAIDTEIIKPMKKERAKKLLGLEGRVGIFVGRPDYTKGFDIVKSLASRFNDITFLCVFPFPHQPGQKNIKTLSNIGHERMGAAYSAADFCINPSRFEGFGYAPLEALACNTPTITSRVGIFNDMKVEGSFLVKRNLPQDFAALINKIPEKVNSRKFIRKEFPLSRFKKEYNDMLTGL